jgi:hypothetical protein
LAQNYPNPFKETTVIKYCVAYKTKVELSIFNSEGKIITKLVDEEKNAGTYEAIFWSFLDSQQLADGNYSYCLEAGSYKNTKTMVLLKNLINQKQEVV